jgi:uncharacterized heparinase superfamily protein
MRDQLTRLFHTARHLRLQQACGQVRRRVALPSVRLSPDPTCAPAYPGCRWLGPKDMLPPAAGAIQAHQVKQGRFRFLNVEQEIGFPPRWTCDSASRLWRYNLHYFDWLWVLDFETGRRVVLDWIRECPNGSDRVGWESYPVSLRLMNWCGFFWGRFRDETENNRHLCETLWGSIYHQCRWLCRHLETHLLGNHYLENAAALTFAGACFKGQHARRWLQRGLRILSGEIREQILPDGMHFELSPMYHLRILHVLASLMETEVASLAELLAEPVDRMARALERLCHPDGGIALLSDSALGVYHEPRHLLSYISEKWPSLSAQGDGCGCFALPDAGYYGWRNPDGTYLIADYGRIGPDYLPGHGHADIFNFEMSLHGHRVITDSGVHDYESSDARRRSRSTAAHSTVEIEGQDQGELWGVFRVARRGYPRDVAWRADEEGFTLSGWHDGYRRLPGEPIHSRRMQWNAADGLLVQDRITSKRPVRCISRLHLHPACHLVFNTGRLARVAYPRGVYEVEAGCEIRVEETPYFERFYQVRTRPCLCMMGEGCPVEIQYRIKPDTTS